MPKSAFKLVLNPLYYPILLPFLIASYAIFPPGTNPLLIVLHLFLLPKSGTEPECFKPE